jgi:hypothetical protein
VAKTAFVPRYDLRIVQASSTLKGNSDGTRD